MNLTWQSALAALCVAATLLGCSEDEGEQVDAGVAPPLLDESLEWYGDNRAALDDMILAHGNQGDDYDPANPPVAVFDWDNTMIKNDIGDATTFYMINNNKIRQPPDRDWGNVSPLLTDAARAALKVACDSQGEPGDPLLTDQTSDANKACAAEIFSVYWDGTTVAGEEAFGEVDDKRIEPAYAFTVQLQAGYTPDEIREFGAQARDFSLDNAIDAVQPIGTGEVRAWVRLYPQMQDLVAVMQAHGFDVWVVSASSQYIVEPFAELVGIDADHVIGVRATLEGGETTYRFQGCGEVPEGNGDLITYRDGKRCWINKVIFGADAADHFTPTDQLTDRLIFVAGDSVTDLSMLEDAEHQLVINRGRTELMCHAYFNENGEGDWLINPMFIKPNPQNTDPYACEAFGMPDQQDTVF